MKDKFVPNHIPTYSELNRVCLLEGKAALLRAWYWAKYLDTKKTGWISNDQFFDFIRILGLSKKRAQQLYDTGLDEGWWKISGSGIYLTGISKVLQMLGIDNEGALVLMHQDKFSKLKTFKANCYASWFVRRSWKHFDTSDNGLIAVGEVVISRERLTNLFGITPQTQRQYERISGMIVKETFAFSKISAEDVEKIHLPENTLEGKGGTFLSDVDNDGVQELVRQLPNSYTAQSPWIEKHHKKATSSSGQILKGQQAKADRPSKVFFASSKEVREAEKNGKFHGGYMRTKNIVVRGKSRRGYEMVF